MKKRKKGKKPKTQGAWDRDLAAAKALIVYLVGFCAVIVSGNDFTGNDILVGIFVVSPLVWVGTHAIYGWIQLRNRESVEQGIIPDPDDYDNFRDAPVD